MTLAQQIGALHRDIEKNNTTRYEEMLCTLTA